MDKLIITPGKVRGLGNLLTPKQVEDLILYQSDVSIASDGTFIMDYTQNNLIVSDYETVVINSASTSVTVRVLDDNQSPIADVPVTLYDGATSIKTGTTDSDGYAVLNYTLSTDGSHMLHVEGNNLKSKRWEVFVKTISSITLSRSSAEVWKGSEVTFSALVQDSNQNIIAGVPVQFILSDGVSVLKNVTVTTDANGTASTSYEGQFFSNGNLTCNATCGGVSESTLVTEIYRYYVNGPVHSDDLVLMGSSGSYATISIDANGNLVFEKNQPQDALVTFKESLPQKFNIAWEYKGSITNFNGTEFGIGKYNDYLMSFVWYDGTIVRFTNSTFTVNGQTFSGSLQTGDIFNFNYDGSSLEISQIRSNTVLWSKVITVSIEDGTLGFNFATYNGYKMNNVIATYYDRNPPVPSFDGISLTGDKNILSAADSEYVTLEAQLTDGGSAAAVSGETVSFKVYKASDDTLIDTLTDDTDSTGLATVSYYGQGTGDLYIKSSVDSIISSEIYVEDCHFYDDCSTDNLSSYIQNLNNGTVSYTDHSYYIARTSSSISNFNQLQVPVTGLTGNVEFSVEMKLSSITGNTNGGIWLANKLITSSSDYQSMNGYGLEQYSSNKGLIKYTNGSSSNVSRTTPNINTNEWYEFKFKIDNGQLTSTITNVSDDSVVFTNSTSYSYSFSILFLLSNWRDTNSYYRNIKIKPL